MNLDYYFGPKQFGLLILTAMFISFALFSAWLFITLLFSIATTLSLGSLILDAYKQGYINGKYENDIL